MARSFKGKRHTVRVVPVIEVLEVQVVCLRCFGRQPPQRGPARRARGRACGFLISEVRHIKLAEFSQKVAAGSHGAASRRPNIAPQPNAPIQLFGVTEQALTKGKT